MIVGTLRVWLILREARTLKDKRQVVLSIKDKLRNAFNVSVAEVDDEEQRQSAVLGFALVSNEAHAAKQQLGKIVEALRSHPIAEFVKHELEVQGL